MKKVTIFFILFSFFIVWAKDSSGLKRYKKFVIAAINETNNTLQKELLKNALEFVQDGKIIKGSCWDYINAVYNKSGITYNKRATIFKSKKNGPYANINIIKGGDWIYHINHSYHNVGHSGMFITWIDKNKSLALMLSYAGENKQKPARFRVYNIDSTYNIMRAKGTKVQLDGYLSLKEYAIKNKISIFNAMKLVKDKKVDFITKIINNKEKIFIKDSSKLINKKEKPKEPTIKELIIEIEKLKKRVKTLEEKIK